MFLGNTRLAILDLASGANLPYHDENLVLAYNGEIFNFIELRAQLQLLGSTFRTHSDSEVILKAFREWGTDAFARFNGMWAIAIYDRETNRLIVSRDRFGQKPLFFAHTGSDVTFASEVQQLVPLVSGSPDFHTIQSFLQEGTFESRQRTFFNDIREFPKAHYAIVTAEGAVKFVRYWWYPDGPVQGVTAETFDQFTDLFVDSVRLRLRSDVPIALLLSGGVDSTVIAGTTQSLSGAAVPMPAFTYSSEDAEDESRFARQVTSELRWPLVVRRQDPEPGHYCRRLAGLVKHLGRGHSSPAIVATDCLYEAVSEHGIKVALDGQGADELLGGYETYHPVAIASAIARRKWRDAAECLREQARFGMAISWQLYLRNTLPQPMRTIGRRLYGYGRFFQPMQESPDDAPHSSGRPALRCQDAVNRYLIRQHDVGLGNLLFYGDIVAMRRSIENRSPFLDHRLVDFVFAHGPELKISGRRNKVALRQLPAYRRFDQMLNRNKIGFASPIHSATKRRMVDELNASAIRTWPIFTGELTRQLTAGLFAQEKYERLLFRLYQVHLWNEIFQ